MISRDGAVGPVRGDTVVLAGDEVLLLVDSRAATDPSRLFT
jgi:hypothetical protein